MRIDINQLEFIELKLRTIATWLEAQTGLEFTATSLCRIGDTGVHGAIPLRGIDIRMRSTDIGEALQNMINASWQYDPERPNMNCALLHGKQSNMHIHLQTHPRTIKRNC